MSHMKRTSSVNISVRPFSWNGLRHVNESFCIQMSLITHQENLFSLNDSASVELEWLETCEWVMLHTNEACHTWREHILLTWQCVRSVEMTCDMWMSHFAYEWVMSHMKITSSVNITVRPLSWNGLRRFVMPPRLLPPPMAHQICMYIYLCVYVCMYSYYDGNR